MSTYGVEHPPYIPYGPENIEVIYMSIVQPHLSAECLARAQSQSFRRRVGMWNVPRLRVAGRSGMCPTVSGEVGKAQVGTGSNKYEWAGHVSVCFS